VKGHSNLNQSLKKLLVFRRRSAPDVFESLVRIKEFRVIKKTNPANVLIRIHSSFWHSLYRPKIT